jgi:hypothetical protein
VPAVHDFVPIDEGFEKAGTVLISDGGSWLSEHAQAALGSSERVAVEVEDARMIERSVVVRVHWSTGSGPFTTLDADVRLDPMPTQHAHLSFSGTYEASLNGHDQTTERHLTESCVRRFLADVAAALKSGDTKVS